MAHCCRLAFFVHTAVASESLAESVASFLQVARRHNSNGKLAMRHLVWSSQLRAVGCRGFGGEEGLMAQALNIHFQCEGPEGWHFTTTTRSKTQKRAAELRNQLRLLNVPTWFGQYLPDLIASRSLKLCKILPLPEATILKPDGEDASGWQHLKPTAKRQRVAESADTHYNPKEMRDGLWQQLQLSALSLPSCLRPGTRPR